MNKQLQIVTFEQAKKLKELGFDWECSWYSVQDKLLYSTYELKRLDANFKFYVTAPQTALALKWLRDEKNIKVTINDFDNRYKLIIEDLHNKGKYILDKNGYYFEPFFEIYEDAESSGLDLALNYLLK